MEIKIRIWDKSENKMSSFHLLTYMHSNEVHQEEICPVSLTDNMMLFTGLKDMCDNEIYEGDILTAGLDEEGIVFWNDGCFNLTSRESGIQNFDANDRLCSDLIELNNLVVIGNVYQNPELLMG